MSNEDLMKLIVALGSLGYRVVSVNPENKIEDQFGNHYATPRSILVIEPAPHDKQEPSHQ